MCCSFGNRQTHQDIETVLGEHVIRQVDKFKYLGYIVQENYEVDDDVNDRMQTGWFNWLVIKRVTLPSFFTSKFKKCQIQKLAE